jgi:hypothetical protein
MIHGNTRAVVLLGAQRFNPTLAEAVAELGVEGRIAAITAGWQEREEEDDELREHLGGRTVNLRLHARAEEIFRKDPEFHAAHRERQQVLRHRQDFYRIRLEHAHDAQTVIQSRSAPAEILEDEARHSIQAIREIDRMHLERCKQDWDDFDDRWMTPERPAVAEARAEVAELVKGCDAIAVAGGHVASLLNRLRLFGIGQLAEGKIVFAWCGGAMAISDRVVIFHHSPPQGPGAVEVLDEGLGLASNAVLFPQPEFRLKMHERERIQVMVRRFSPSMCLAMPARSRVTWSAAGPRNAHGVISMKEDGSVGTFRAPEGRAA